MKETFEGYRIDLVVLIYTYAELENFTPVDLGDLKWGRPYASFGDSTEIRHLPTMKRSAFQRVNCLQRKPLKIGPTLKGPAMSSRPSPDNIFTSITNKGVMVSTHLLTGLARRKENMPSKNVQSLKILFY